MLDGEVVVQWNEAPIQSTLAEALCREGAERLLEIGYGLGLAHRSFSGARLKEHWVIEGNRDLAVECLLSEQQRKRLPIVLFDTWEHGLTAIQSSYFDSILFDPYPFEGPARIASSWSEKFSLTAQAAALQLDRVLVETGTVGFINFQPAEFDVDSATNAFAGRFSVRRVIRLSELDIRTGTSVGPEAWIMEKAVLQAPMMECDEVATTPECI